MNTYSCYLFILLLLLVIVPNTKSRQTQNPILVSAIEQFSANNITEKCGEQLKKYLANLSFNENSWALKMLDATSKFPSGLMSLNLAELGNFKQCIETKSTQILGQYCLGSIKLNYENDSYNQLMPLGYIANSLPNLGDISKSSRFAGATWAVCLPDGCSSRDLTNLIDPLFREISGNSISIEFSEILCQTENDVHEELTNAAIITILFFGFILLTMLMSTIYDAYCYINNKEHRHQLLIAFSVLTNGRKLFRINKNMTGQFPCINGMRFLSIVWVVAAHQYSLLLSGPITNTSDLINWSNQLYSMFIINGHLSVDTFFVIGGFLVVYGYRQARYKGVSFNIPMFYLHRYLRLTPALAAVVLASSTLINYCGSGPKWPLAKLYFQDNCVNYWWSTLLYIQNYVNVKNMCIGQTWYLSIDTQLFVLSPIILIPLLKWPKSVLTGVVICILSSIAISFYIAWTNNLTAILSNIYGNSLDYSNKYYLLTHTRASAWLIGSILGYCLFEIKNNNITIHLNNLTVIILWLICFVILLGCVLIGHDTLRDSVYNKLGNVLHITLVRPLWSLGISWIIFACILGYGGPVNRILALPVFQILNRFTYSIYLTHVTLLYLIQFAKKSPDYFSNFNAMYLFWGALWFSFGLALILILAFESPMITIEKVIFGQTPKKKTLTNSGQSHTNLGYQI